MTEAASAAGQSEIRRGPAIPDGVAGMMIFVVCEIMMFAAFLSAYVIVKAGASNWPPSDQPRLPAASTALFSLCLLASGVFVFLANRASRSGGEESLKKTRRLLATGVILGAIFVLCQGREWMQLIHYGLTMVSSNYGAFFYTIIGAHALHAVGALVLWFFVLLPLWKGELKVGRFQAAQVLWYFIVLIWPVLYVYLYLK